VFRAVSRPTSVPYRVLSFARMTRLAIFVLLLGVGLNLSCCSKKPLPGDTSFSEANKGFQKELTPEQRKAAIKNLQTETASKP
jgi:hypothetical protein